MRCFSPFVLVALLFAATGRGQGSPAVLRDGQQVTLTGRLVMEPQGRLQFVAVKTIAAFKPVFKGEHGSEQQGEVLHEVGIAGYSDYASIYQHRGQPVTVAGRLATDNVTPYFLHGTRLQATSIRLADGTELLHARSAVHEPIAADTGTYQAAVMLPSDLSAPWLYSAGGSPVPEGRFLSCSSNGGGDVVNCSCADGFHPVSGSSAAGGRTTPARLFGNGGTAQFEAGDDKQAVRLSVTCSR